MAERLECDAFSPRIVCWQLFQDPILMISFLFYLLNVADSLLVVRFACGIHCVAYLEALNVELALCLWILSGYFAAVFLPTVPRR